MNKQQAQQTANQWLKTHQPPGNKHIISCGQLGAIIALKNSQNQWTILWADQITILSDLQHHTPKIAQTKTHKCPHCARTFTKNFALTNHIRTCPERLKILNAPSESGHIGT